jgi:hypothetical protein
LAVTWNMNRHFRSGFLFTLLIILFACKSNSEKPEAGITFNEVAPVIYKKCTPCHHPGSGAPFNLITYRDVKKHLHTVQLTINERIMPPWPADTSYSRFRDEKVLTKEEIDLIGRWIADGAAQGDSTQLPHPPVFNPNSVFGKPDVVVTMKTFQITGDNKDKFIMLKIPFELPQDTFIRAIEIVPGNKKLVHHVNAHLIQYDDGKKKNQNTGAAFVNTEEMDKLHAYAALGLANDDGSYPMLTPSVSNYLPGVEVSLYPDGIGGHRVKKEGAILLDNIHYGPSAVDTTDATSFNFFFSPKPPSRPVSEFILGTSGITPVEPPLVIPPGEVKTFHARYKVPQDISLLTINPHMHLLGKSFKAYVLLENNDTLKLIYIPRWDFRWQYFYTFQSIVKIPAGSIMVIEGVYDNTENNPLNPFHPPKTISEREGSMRTTDEMFQLICSYMPYKAGDENISLK